MGPGDGQATGPVQEVLRHPHQGPGVRLDAPGAAHPQDGGALCCVGCTGRGKSTVGGVLLWHCIHTSY